MPGNYEPDIGYSLWLVPPRDHLEHQLLLTLILDKIPTVFEFPSSSENEPPVFFPHVILTSAIPKEVVGDDPKAWLEGLKLPNAAQIRVRFIELDKGSTFFKKLFLRAEKPGLREIARLSRLQGVLGTKNENGPEAETVEAWVDKEYDPHASLLYWNLDISDEKLKESADACSETRDRLAEMDRYKQYAEEEGWDGGVVWLVPTFLKIEEWRPVAERTL